MLCEVREQRRPGYLLLSTDVARFETEPPTAPLPRYTGGTSPRALALFTEAATDTHRRPPADRAGRSAGSPVECRRQSRGAAGRRRRAARHADVGQEPGRRERTGIPGYLRRLGQRRAGTPGDRRGAGARDGGGGVHRHGQRLLQPAHRPGPDHRHRAAAEHRRHTRFSRRWTWRRRWTRSPRSSPNAASPRLRSCRRPTTRRPTNPAATSH